jgi:pimeloyl-ACP methyl ester carboxylesterase
MKKTVITIALFTLFSQAVISQETSLTNTSKSKLIMADKVNYLSVKVDGLDIFYREAGDKTKPTILLLHGLPSSSHMYKELINNLSSNYHLIAPDYPGFGQSSTPSPDQFEYSFENLASVMEHFIDKLKLKKINLYVHDYGGPIGFRIAVKRPELISSFIIQNANAYTEGLGPIVHKMGNLAKSEDKKAYTDAIQHLLSDEAIKEQYTDGARDLTKINPDNYILDQFYMNREGVRNIQDVLFRNYGTNFPKYDEWHNYFSNNQPPALILWGKNDQIFIVPGAEAYKKDLKNAEVHLFDGGHFMLEEYHTQAAKLINNFIQKRK